MCTKRICNHHICHTVERFEVRQRFFISYNFSSVFFIFLFGLEMRPREANRTGSPVAHLFTNWTNRMTNFNRKYVSGDARMCVFELVLWAMYLIVDGRLQVCVHVTARQHCIQVTHSHINTLLSLLLLSPSLNYF